MRLWVINLINSRTITRAKVGSDNRLLPKGYRDEHPDATYTKAIGLNGDSDFVDGSDRVQYRITLPADKQITKLKIKLVYQTLGARLCVHYSKLMYPRWLPSGPCMNVQM